MGSAVAAYLRRQGTPPAGPQPGRRRYSAAAPAQATGEPEPAPLTDGQKANIYKLDTPQVRELARVQIERAKALMERVTAVRWYDFVPVLGAVRRWGEQLQPYVASRDKVLEAEQLYEAGEKSKSADNVRKTNYASAYFLAYEATAEAGILAVKAGKLTGPREVWGYLVEAVEWVKQAYKDGKQKADDLADDLARIVKLGATLAVLYGGYRLLSAVAPDKERP